MVIVAGSMVQVPWLLAVFLLCARSSSTSVNLVTTDGNNYQVQALMSIKALLKDPNRVLDNWDKDVPEPCTWNMVTCSDEYLVVSLEAPSLNLSGSLSPGIANLTDLDTVLLQGNDLSGKIPPEIGNLSKLRVLDLSHNHFYGQIPASFEHLHNLEFLNLSYNNLSGPLPPWFVERKYNIVGNPLICGTDSQDCSGIRSVTTTANHTHAESNNRYRNSISFLHVIVVILITCAFLSD